MRDEQQRELGERIEEEARREAGKGYVSSSQDFFWDWGGWYTAELLEYNDRPYLPSRTLRYHDVRAWGNFSYLRDHRLYYRGQVQWVDYNSGEGFDADEDDDDDSRVELRTDQFFYEYDLDSWLGNLGYTGGNAKIAVGRQFFRVGAGMVYNNVHDGIKISGTYNLWRYQLLGAMTISSSTDIDQSRPGSHQSRRNFFGGQLNYTIGKNNLYGFVLVQRDQNGEEPADGAQEYDYNSNYLGIGAKGDLIPRVAYTTELVYQTGESGIDGSLDSMDIAAYGLQAGLEWWPNVMEPRPPRLHLAYLYGQGDRDRSSVTNTVGGNNDSTKDRGFLPFGYTSTGIVLYPKVSNLHIIRAGFGFSPFYDTTAYNLHRMRVDLAYYKYIKDHSVAAISDSRATENDDDVGREVDLTLRWRILSDLGANIRMGWFLPGGAYPEDSNERRRYYSFSLTYSF
jgi:hypothetical protein